MGRRERAEKPGASTPSRAFRPRFRPWPGHRSCWTVPNAPDCLSGPGPAPAAAPPPAPASEQELGELLFGIVAAARRNGLDAERALRAANRRFEDTRAAARRYGAASGAG